MKGLITYYNPARRFGFIRSAGVDYFFHATNVVSDFSPKINVEVEFETDLPIAIGKRVQATQIRIAGGAL